MKSLSTRLTAMMLVICLVGMGLVTTLSALLFRRSLLEEAFDKMGQSTAKEAGRINGWLDNQAAYITALATDLAFMDTYDRDILTPRFGTHVDMNAQYFDVYMGLPNGIALFSSGFEPDYAGGWDATKRPWYAGAAKQIGVPYVTDPYTDVQTGGLCITAAMTVIRSGQVAGVAAADILIDKLNEIVLQTSVGEKSYAFMVDAAGSILIHPDSAYGPNENDIFQPLSAIEGGIYAGLLQDAAQDGNVAKVKGSDGVARYYTAQTIEATGWRLYTAIPVSVVEAPIYSMVLTFAIAFVVVLLAAFGLIFVTVRRFVVQPIANLTKAAERLAEGSTDIHVTRVYEDEIGHLIDAFTNMAASIRQQVEATEVIAGGDLTIQVPARSDHDAMGRALQSLQGDLNRFIRNIAAASDNVSSQAGQISNNSQSLAQGSTEQAATVRELVDSIAAISDKIALNTEKARATSQASSEIAHNARNSTQQINGMIEAVKEINDASADISKVIKTIEDIAFQTNILALNAAVEAARAGQHGKGFAVVADEVRNLASKSAQAAQETTTLIENSIRKSADGVRIAEATSHSMRVIIGGIEETAALTEDIRIATAEQAQAITQINDQIEQVNQVVAANATISEECAAVAVELSSEATRLASQVKQFRVDGQNSALPSPSPSPFTWFDRPDDTGISIYDKYQ